MVRAAEMHEVMLPRLEAAIEHIRDLPVYVPSYVELAQAMAYAIAYIEELEKRLDGL